MAYSMAPCLFHPTTVLFVDDDLDAMNNYTVALPPNFSFKTFTVPEEALAYIHSSERIKPLHERCKPLIQDINLFEREITYGQRFTEHCVVVADYAMPSMNGLDFCRAIDSPYIAKILLTGIGDEKLAVQAFNDELIDRFLMKQHRQVLTMLAVAIEGLQWRYFCQVSQQVNKLMGYRLLCFLQDHRFIDFFETLREQRHFCEFYAARHPPGFTCIDDDGVISRLVVYTRDDLDFQLQAAISNHAPDALIQRLKNDTPGTLLPYFWQSMYGVYDQTCTNWQDCFYPAKQLSGARQTYYYAFIDNPPGVEVLTKDMDSFISYLAQSGNLALRLGK